MICVFYIVLIICAFLRTLNGFLRGSKKGLTDSILNILLITLIIITFIVNGLTFGLIAIAITLISITVTRPFAAKTASKLLSMSSSSESGPYVGLPPKPLENISQELSDSDITLNGRERLAKAKEALLDYCEGHADILNIMKEFQISRDDLRKLYSNLIEVGLGQWRCGHWVAASSLAYPETLRYLLMRKDQEDFEYAALYLIYYFERGAPLESFDEFIGNEKKNKLTE